MHDARNDEARYHVSIRIAQDDLMLDDFFASQNDFFRRHRSFAHDAKVAPDVRVALSVRPLDVEDRHIRLDRAYRDQLFVAKRAMNSFMLFMALRNRCP